MSAEENKALVRRYVEEFVDRSKFDLSEEIFAPNFVRYDAGPDQVARVEDLKHFFAMLHSGFPGFHSTIKDLLSEGDKVALRFTFRGIHQGEFMGIAPTGKEVTMSGIEGGKHTRWAKPRR
jgi:predicted ester cyclase